MTPTKYGLSLNPNVPVALLDLRAKGLLVPSPLGQFQIMWHDEIKPIHAGTAEHSQVQFPCMAPREKQEEEWWIYIYSLFYENGRKHVFRRIEYKDFYTELKKGKVEFYKK